jgi:hypothetical protein
MRLLSLEVSPGARGPPFKAVDVGSRQIDRSEASHPSEFVEP